MTFFFTKNLKKTFLFIAIAAVVSFNAVAEKTKIDGLFRYKLDNGLELYVAENHSVPLVYIELAVRAGAISQTKETSGLFHLYEHMMFKGNSLYKDAASVTKALADLGVTSRNGTTSNDYVNYYFTIPSSKLEEGLAFWNAAIRTPLISEKEFENEKKVVLSEIQGDQANPSYVLHYYTNLLLFPDEPYRTDPRGSFDVVSNATVAQMRNMQKEFYIPCNSAIFVGGDVDPQETYELVKKIYGTWKNTVGVVSQKIVSVTGAQASTNPLNEKKFIVMPYDRMSADLAEIEITWRGPDFDYDYEDCENGAYLDYILGMPNSKFKTSLLKKEEYKIPDLTYAGSFLSLGRKNSSLGCYVLVKEPGEKLAERAKDISSYIQNSLYPEIGVDKSLFTSRNMKNYRNSQEDSLVRRSETPESLVTLARQCWIDGEIEYFLKNKKEKPVKQNSVQKFIEKYIVSKNALVTVIVNPSVYEKTRSEFLEAGFYEVKSDEEIWWKKEKFAVNVKDFPKETDFVLEDRIYIPEKNSSAYKEVDRKRNVDVVQLKNGIKVYVQHSNSKMNAIAIGCLGGYEKYKPDLSGLEGCLFDVMSSSSKKYSMEARNQMQYDNGITIDKYCRTRGSVLYMYGMEKYFDGYMDVFIDGFLHPEFAENVIENLNDGNAQRVQRIMNSPESLLSWTMTKDVFKGHPYETVGGVTPDSIDNITVERMKEVHDQILGGGDFFIAATGSFNTKKLIKTLNRNIGQLKFDPAKKHESKDIPQVKIEHKKPVVVTHPSAAGTAYCVRAFASPSIDNPDTVPAFLAGMIYSDILYNVVREHHGVCYTPSSNVITSKAPVSEDYLYKVSDYGKVGMAVKEAMGYMSKGVIVEKSNDDGTYVFSTVAENLESYKSKWINSKYGSSKTTSGQMFRIMSDIMYYEDMDHDLKEVERIKELTADDVVRVFNKYWVERNSTWYAVTFPGNEKNLVLE
ncbi:M16 family metallopeptidase [Treponema sp.]|uniref:M16 family metallopeptidase n=1 Tax=Treponema sp. TaxID=166 RepID=UPI00388DEC34